MITEQEKKMHRCCFTGHRTEKLQLPIAEVQMLLKEHIKQAIADGFTTYISGMARGVDLIAASIILEERKHNAEIHLICAVPYDGFETRWNNNDIKEYCRILNEADLVKYICKHYSRCCFQIRNCWMVDHSSRVIAAYNGTSGGTRNTIVYAKQKCVEIHNIFKEAIDRNI